MSDLISRQEAIDAIEFGITYAKAIDTETGEVKELFQASNDELRKAEDRIKHLPSAQPEQQIPQMRGWVCPVCGRGISPYTSVCPCNNGRDWGKTC